MMVSFIDTHRAAYGIEPICRQLPIAPSMYYEHQARAADPERVPARAKRDQALAVDVRRIWDENKQVYGAKKVWKQLRREQRVVARCTVERLMQGLGLQGVRRGGVKRWTTIRDDNLAVPTDRVNRQFIATRPNQLWVADITLVVTWMGMVYVALVTDVIHRRGPWRTLEEVENEGGGIGDFATRLNDRSKRWLQGRAHRGTRYSVRAPHHSSNDNVNFCMFILDIENILADAILTRVCDIYPYYGIFGLAPGDREFCYFPAAERIQFHDLSSPAICQHFLSVCSNPAALCAQTYISKQNSVKCGESAGQAWIQETPYP